MKVWVVTGCHRSATSLLAKSLHDGGVHMGDKLLGTTVHQPHGHYECVEAVQINERLLHSVGATWDRPKPVLDAGDDITLLQDYVVHRSDREMWGMKDPRFVFTFPAWRATLTDVDLHLVMAWRGVEQIAASLHRRDQIPMETCRTIAKQYHAQQAWLAERLA